MSMEELPGELSEMSDEQKRRVFEERIDIFRNTAFGWHVQAETLRKLRVPKARMASHKREVAEALENAQRSLGMLRITQEIMDEVLPLTTIEEDLDETLTLDNMNEEVCLADLEKAMKENANGATENDNV